MRFLKSLTLFLAVTCALMLAAMPVHAQEQAAPQKAVPTLAGLVNINAASTEELCLLPGVDKKTAEAIVSFRAKNGNFKAINDLGKVNGIGPKRLGKIKQYLALEGETTLKKK
ncbi:MAG: ComEA family DNA-binding protein [Proteobacteria bacterium]|nr:ComEA family DNA-binding protein [Pseudomonadota bacterium]